MPLIYAFLKIQILKYLQLIPYYRNSKKTLKKIKKNVQH
jgi:hypothetical protein